MDKYKATMAKCKTFAEWQIRFLRAPYKKSHRDAWDALNETPKPKRKRRTKAEMEAARVETAD